MEPTTTVSKIKKNKINCECGRVYIVNITVNPDSTITTTTEPAELGKQNNNNKLKRVSSTKLISLNNNNNKKLKLMSIETQSTVQSQLFECSLCHKKYDNIQNAGKHILKCNQHLSTSSSSSIDKDENNNNNNEGAAQPQDSDDDEEVDDDTDEPTTMPTTVPIQTPKQLQQNDFSKIKCPICSKPYSSNHTMLRHKMSIHDKLIKYCCKICDRSFFRKDKLATHISNHQDFDTYVCFICESKLKSKQVLKTHFKKDHNLNGDEANYNELILKCQLKETIDIDSNMIVNYGDDVSKNEVVVDETTTTVVVGNNDDNFGSLVRNRKGLVYDILNTPFESNAVASNIDGL
jgi:hypothetical protein